MRRMKFQSKRLKNMGISAPVAVGIPSTVKDLKGYCGFSDTENTQNTRGVAVTQ